MKSLCTIGASSSTNVSGMERPSARFKALLALATLTLLTSCATLFPVRDTYWIPGSWTNLNIEQEAEMVSLYAVLTYLFTRDNQRWRQWDTWYTREDLSRIEDYMRREMYF